MHPKTVSEITYGGLYAKLMNLRPLMASENFHARFVKKGTATCHFQIATSRINLYDCQPATYFALLARLDQAMEVCVELNSGVSHVHVGGLGDAVVPADYVSALPGFTKKSRGCKAFFSAQDVTVADFAFQTGLLIMFESVGHEIFSQAVHAVLQSLEEEVGTESILYKVTTAHRSPTVASTYPGVSMKLLDDSCTFVNTQDFSVSVWDGQPPAIKCRTKAAAVRAFGLWRKSYSPCTFQRMEGVGAYVEIACGDEHLCAVRDVYWQAKIRLERAEHLEEGSVDLEPLRQAVLESMAAGEAAVNALRNMAPRTVPVVSADIDGLADVAESDVLAFASLLDTVSSEPVGLCFQNVDLTVGGLFREYVCDLLSNEPASIFGMGATDESDDDATERLLLTPADDMAWNRIFPFLRCIKTAAGGTEAHPAKRVPLAGNGLQELLLDRRLLRVKGNLISSFMAGAITLFLPRLESL
jgi:hypothetical protein